MRPMMSAIAAGLIILISSSVTHAQRRMPGEGTLAVGGAVGAFFPAEEELSTGPHLEGQFQYHFSPRVGLRFGLGWTDPDFDDESEDSLRQLRVGADLIYNWEHGEWHPFVGAGLGAHLLQFKDNGEDFGDGESKLGAALLGGAEYFFTRDATITGEVRYHFVPEFENVSPAGFLLAAGIKKYF